MSENKENSLKKNTNKILVKTKYLEAKYKNITNNKNSIWGKWKNYRWK